MSYSTKKSQDLIFGDANEIIIKPIIEKYFETKVVNTKETIGKFCVYDFENVEQNTRYELKSRRIMSNIFKEVFISTRKIKKGFKEGNKLILLFYFLDGLFFIEYKKKKFKNFKVDELVFSRDGKIERDEVIYISVEKLKKIIFN
jgi:hypothetical protein